MQQYNELVMDILKNGETREDRTGVGTKSVFGRQIRFNLKEGFPAITTKKLAWKSCVAELLWFLEGSSDERRLAELTHGTRDPEKKTIWTANAQAEYWKDKAKFDGDLGRIYGKQWTDWNTHQKQWSSSSEYNIIHVNQIDEVIQSIKNDPFSRRHIVSAWNVGELNQMALPPCHVMFQFYVGNDNGLSCHMYQRSCDVGLGFSFNCASYALLTHMIAQVTGNFPKELVMSIGDAHLYLNSISAIEEQLTRVEFPLPTLELNPEITNIKDFTMSDINLHNYQYHDAIFIPMAV